ncbi:MAG: hypothetical protein J7K23_06160 [Thermoproteales archaeon]|nr:hypothetical protein [Thermoproteales archaeon]
MKIDKIYTLLIGDMYLFFGFVQFLNGLSSIFLGFIPFNTCISVSGICIPNIFPDVFSGIALLTTGLLFVSSLYFYGRDVIKAKGYFLVGWILAILMLGLNIVEILSNILDAYYPILFGGEPNFVWSICEDSWGIAPHLLLGLLILPMYFENKIYLSELFPKKFYKTR